MEITNKELLSWLKMFDENVKSSGDTITIKTEAVKKIVQYAYECEKRWPK